nr:unnamed protein product [Digitaria exilis]
MCQIPASPPAAASPSSATPAPRASCLPQGGMKSTAMAVRRSYSVSFSVHADHPAAVPDLGGNHRDHLLPGKPLTPGYTLVSDDGTFALGFFSLSKSTDKHYVGIWYNNIPQHTFVWVANRVAPIANLSSAMLALTSGSNIVLSDDPKSFLQRFLWNSTTPHRRSLVWSSYFLLGSYMDKLHSTIFMAVHRGDDDEVYMSFGMPIDSLSLLIRMEISYLGKVNILNWNSNMSAWTALYTEPAHECNVYAYCGPYGYCDNSGATSTCKCLDGFEPKDDEDWINGRNKSFDECTADCLNNCSCVAYAYANMSTRAIDGDDTSGYMSPEYALEGVISVKSDVYSFGVLLLEIVSGLKISTTDPVTGPSNLIAYAWSLWKDGNLHDLVDSSIVESCSPDESLRCIHIGLLLVQDDPNARPLMPWVVSSLDNNDIELPQPSESIYFARRNYRISEAGESYVSDMSLGTLEGR